MYLPEIDRTGTLRYLGYGGASPDAEALLRLERMEQLCLQEARPAWRFRIMELAFQDGAPVLLPEGVFLPGGDIAAHLRGGAKCAVLAVTLGFGAERALLSMQHRSMTDAMVLDAVMSACVEKAADACCREIADKAQSLSLHPGERYSPGYGDLPLACQDVFERLLGMRSHLGIALTPARLLMPQKSVTAFVGLFPGEPPRRPAGCAACVRREGCPYRTLKGASDRLPCGAAPASGIHAIESRPSSGSVPPV